jgi:hypothetical protein
MVADLLGGVKINGVYLLDKLAVPVIKLLFRVARLTAGVAGSRDAGGYRGGFMNRIGLPLAAALAVGVLACVPAARANILVSPVSDAAPDGFPLNLGAGSTLAADTGVVSIFSNIFPDFTGTLHEQVWRDTANTFGSGDLTWLITVSNNPTPPPFPGSINNIERLTASTFTGFQTDVGFFTGAAGVRPATVDRVNPGVIGFNFDPGLAPGQDSTILQIETNATSWTGGNLSVINEGVASISAFEPTVPEPSTWAMMVVGFGLLGLAAIRRGRREAVSAA